MIELDGGQHAEHERYDNHRTACLRGNGWRLIRFWNDDVLLRTEHVLEAILIALAHTTHPNPLPTDGEREQ